MFKYNPPTTPYVWSRDEFARKYIHNIERAFLYLTEKCNLKCRACYVNAGEKYCQEADYSLMRDAVYSSKSYGAKSIIIMGGEPTIWPHFFDLLKYTLDNNLHIVIDSNGDLPAQQIIKRIINEIPNGNQRIRLNFSIDSHIEEKHNVARGRKNNFKNLINTIKIAKSNNFIVSTATTVTSETVNDLLDTFNFLENLGVNEANVHIMSLEGRALQISNLLVPPDIWLKTIDKIFEIGPRNNLNLRFPLVFLPKDSKKASKIIEKYNLKNTSLCIGCIGINQTDRIGVRPNGQIHVCGLVGFTDLAAFQVTSKGNLITRTKKAYKGKTKSELDLYKYYKKNPNEGCQATKLQNELYPGYITLCRHIKVIIPAKSHKEDYFKKQHPGNCNFLNDK